VKDSCSHHRLIDIIRLKDHPTDPPWSLEEMISSNSHWSWHILARSSQPALIKGWTREELATRATKIFGHGVTRSCWWDVGGKTPVSFWDSKVVPTSRVKMLRNVISNSSTAVSNQRFHTGNHLVGLKSIVVVNREGYVLCVCHSCGVSGHSGYVTSIVVLSHVCWFYSHSCARFFLKTCIISGEIPMMPDDYGSCLSCLSKSHGLSIVYNCL